MIDQRTASRIATVLHALGEPTRLKLIRQLAGGGMSVNALAAAVNCPVVNVSHHLSVLRDAGLLTVERRGRQRFHALTPDFHHNGTGLGEFRFDGCTVALTDRPAAG